MDKLMEVDAFIVLVMTIANLNRAMRSAAENPMDDWRREDVRRAMSAMPAAIIGLANVFKENKLHDDDLPMVQGILGGFIDVNAADNYKKFLQKPSADLIPKVGASFPSEYLNGSTGVVSKGVRDGNGKASTMRIGYDDSISKAKANSPEMQLKPEEDEENPKQSAVDNAKKQGSEKLDKISMPGGAAKPAPSLKTAPPASSGAASETSSPESPAEQRGSSAEAGAGGEAVRDLVAPRQGRMSDTPSILTIIRKGPASDSSLDSDFFIDRSPSSANSQDKRKDSDPRNYRIQPKPKNWQSGPFLKLLEALVISEVFAEGQGQGECENCKGGGGGNAAGILFGVAAIIAAIAPMVVASIQAEADKYIADRNADAQEKMTKMTSDTSKFLANQQMQIALTQTAVSQQIAQQNNSAVSQRLAMQLAELRSAREDQVKQENARLDMEKDLNSQRIALAQKQADDNLNLARQTLNAQLTQAGLMPGYTTSQNSGTGLTVSSVISSGGRVGNTVAAGSVSGPRTPTIASSSFAGGGANYPTTSNIASSYGGSGSLASGSLGLGATSSRAMTGQTSQGSSGQSRLLSSLGRGAHGMTATNAMGQELVYHEPTGEWVTADEFKRRERESMLKGLVKGKASSGSSLAGNYYVRSASVGRGYVVMDENLRGFMSSQRTTRGSFKGSPDRITSLVSNSYGSTTTKSDLKNFIDEGSQNSFAKHYDQGTTHRAMMKTSSSSTASGGHTVSPSSSRSFRDAYNPPASR